MKCPKCNYVSHDYLDACRKCGVDLADFKLEIGLAVLQPGVLDLGLILGDLGTDDIFAGIDEEVTMHAGEEDDFDISLDDHLEQTSVRRGPQGVVRAGTREPEDDMIGMDHLTLELDSLDVPPEFAAQLRELRSPREGEAPPPVPAGPAALRPGAVTLPGHLTVEMEPGNLSTKLPASLFQEPPPPPPASSQVAPEVASTEEPPSHSLEFDLSQMHLPPEPAGTTAIPPESHTESLDTQQNQIRTSQDSSGSMPSLSLEDVLLAEESGESLGPTPTTIHLDTVHQALDTQGASGDPGSTAIDSESDLLMDGYEISWDEAPPAVPSPASDTLSGGPERPSGADATTAPQPSSDEISLDDLDLLPSFEFAFDVPEASETTTPAEPTSILDQEPRSLDQAASALLPPTAATPLAPITLPDPEEEALSSSDMFALERLEEPGPTGHLTLELHSTDLPPDLAEQLLDEAARTLSDIPSTQELFAGRSLDVVSPDGEPLSLSDIDEIDPEAPMTLELDRTEMQTDMSSLIIETLQRETPTSKMTPPPFAVERQENDGDDALLLDLDHLTLEDDEPK